MYKKKIGIQLLLIVILIFSYACAKKDVEVPQIPLPLPEKVKEEEKKTIQIPYEKKYEKEPEAKKKIIGALLPLTGKYRNIGSKALSGIELALYEFKKKLGITAGDKSKIDIIVKDTEADSKKAANAVQELKDANVSAIIGPIIACDSAAKKAEELKIPMILLTHKPGIVEERDYVFRNFLTPESQIKAILSYAVAEKEFTKFAILYPEESYGRLFMNLFWNEAINRGVKVVGVESYNPEDTDFAEPIKKLVMPFDDLYDTEKKESNFDETFSETDNNQTDIVNVDFDAIFIPDAPQKVGLLVPQLAFYDIRDVYLFGTNLWHSQELIELADKYVQGAIMPDGFFADSSDRHVVDFTSVFYDIFRKKPEFIEAVSYDTTMILLNALIKRENKASSEIIGELKKNIYHEAVTGKTYFDNTGEAQKELHLLQIEGRGFKEIYRKESLLFP